MQGFRFLPLEVRAKLQTPEFVATAGLFGNEAELFLRAVLKPKPDSVERKEADNE